ncbi:glycosyl hydrolase family 61-domain-containing protein [Fimicolochytrium jonesii]|uniref:glycosyl hydrolase family 61-domain-containing protein n=1 Tax=Fimicolochytrium jonesii TaxID=1396493 RepID=UPI0022FE1506|nr:glycosyl hydrolase family 61-domain-containing protein [Fimicolochytrium jonesii]KAI8825743.1 glycosyl hydrolase family 61-domain-containing protein [Fimicolochytrium jonesii]
MKTASALAILSLAVSSVAAHGAITSYVIDGKPFQGWNGYAPTGAPTIQRQWPSYDPIVDVLSEKMTCNGGTSAALSAEVLPGSNVTAQWGQWTHSPGPITVYMYKCPADFATCDGEDKKWFKIEEKGLISGTLGNGQWALGEIQNTRTWSTAIPEGLAPGNYLIRHELLALHATNQPQFYPECAQLKVGGTGTANPDASYFTSIPGFAQPNDPNVMVNLYSNEAQTITEYKIIGPPVWKLGAAPAPSASAPAPPATTPVASSSPTAEVPLSSAYTYEDEYTTTTTNPTTATPIRAPTESTDLPYCDETTTPAAPIPTAAPTTSAAPAPAPTTTDDSDLPYCDEISSTPAAPAPTTEAEPASTVAPSASAPASVPTAAPPATPTGTASCRTLQPACWREAAACFKDFNACTATKGWIAECQAKRDVCGQKANSCSNLNCTWTRRRDARDAHRAVV